MCATRDLESFVVSFRRTSLVVKALNLDAARKLALENITRLGVIFPVTSPATVLNFDLNRGHGCF